MIDIFLMFVLAIGFFIGFRRGLVLQVVHLSGFIVSLIIAYLCFDQLAPHLKLWIPYPDMLDHTSVSFFLESVNFEAAFYRAVAFAILFFGTKIVMHIIGTMLDFLADLPLLSTVNGWLGGLLCLVEVYLLLFLILYIGALTPLDFIQTVLQDSVLARGIVENTPVFSAEIKELWLDQMVTKLP